MPVSLTIKYDDSRPHNSVEVAGEFSGWRPVGLKLERPQGTSYAIEVPDLELGKKYMYKFIIDGEWILASDGREARKYFVFYYIQHDAVTDMRIR